MAPSHDSATKKNMPLCCWLHMVTKIFNFRCRFSGLGLNVVTLPNENKILNDDKGCQPDLRRSFQVLIFR